MLNLLKFIKYNFIITIDKIVIICNNKYKSINDFIA